MPTDTRGVHIWLVMLKAFHAMNGYAARSFQSHGLGDSDFRVLEALLHKGPLPVNTIGPKVFLTPGSISIAVDRLYEKGLVTRMESGTDRRVRVVDVTPKGRDLIATIFTGSGGRTTVSAPARGMSPVRPAPRERGRVACSDGVTE